MSESTKTDERHLASWTGTKDLFSIAARTGRASILPTSCNAYVELVVSRGVRCVRVVFHIHGVVHHRMFQVFLFEC
jgi:hypothetical protein